MAVSTGQAAGGRHGAPARVGRRGPAPSLKGAVLTLCEGLNPAAVALCFAGLVALFAGLYLAGDLTGEHTREALEYGVGITLPALVTGAFLLAVGGLAMLRGWARRSSPQAYAGTAIALAIITAIAAADTAGRIHERIWERSGTGAELALPPLLAGAVMVMLGAWLVRSVGVALSIWLAGGLAWAGSLALGLAGYYGDYVAVIELAGACLFALALLVALRARTATRKYPRSGTAARNAALQALHSVRAETIAAALGFAIVAQCVTGVLLRQGAFDLSAEQTIPALFTSALLFLAAGLGLAARTTGGRFAWSAISVALAVMAADELVRGHERLQGISPVDPSQLILLPYAGLVGYIWLRGWRRLSGLRAAAALWLGGALVWVASQGLDVVDLIRGQPNEGALRWNWVVQEGLEMAGSALFLLALLLFLQASVQRPAPLAATAARPDPAWRDPRAALSDAR